MNNVNSRIAAVAESTRYKNNTALAVRNDLDFSQGRNMNQD